MRIAEKRLTWRVISAALLVGLAAPALAQSPAAGLPPTWKVCVPNGAAEYVVDQHKLAQWLVSALNVEESRPEILFAGFTGDRSYWQRYAAKMSFTGITDPAQQKKLQDQQAAALNSALFAAQAMGSMAPAAHQSYASDGKGPFDAVAWFAQASPATPRKIVCAIPQQAAAPPAGGAGTGTPGAAGSPRFPSLANLRLRGTPDTVALDNKSAVFAAADKATVSFSDNGTTKTRSDALQATIGYAVGVYDRAGQDSKDTVDLVPFVATNRNVTNSSNKPAKFNIEYVMLGVTGDYTHNGIFTPAGSVLPFANTLTLSPDYLLNLVDDSRLLFLHAADMPIVNGRLNDYAFTAAPDGSPLFEFMPVFDIRADLGDYTDRGSSPATNRNFARLGSQFGASMHVDPLSSDITVTHTFLHSFSGVPYDINYFQASWTYNIVPKFVGLGLSFKNGVLETTAQRDQSWLLSVGAKY